VCAALAEHPADELTEPADSRAGPRWLDKDGDLISEIF
jgi:hypothetical protein